MIAYWQPLFYNPDTSVKTVTRVDSPAIDYDSQSGPYAPTYQDSAPNPWQPCGDCGQKNMLAPIPGQPMLPPTQQPFNPYLPTGQTPATGSPTVGSPATGTRGPAQILTAALAGEDCGCAGVPWWGWLALGLLVLVVLKD